MTTTVLFIRHGRSHANAQGVLAGRSDTELDEDGIEQARGVGRALADVPVDLVLSSPQLRARQTAELVCADRCGIEVDDAFAECDYGDWSGAALSELATEPAWDIVQWQPSAANFPQGETMAQMAHRATARVRQVVAEHPGQIIWVVSHGDVIKAIIADALGLHLDHFQRLVVDTASVSMVTYADHRPFVELVNYTGRVRLARKPDGNAAEAVVGGRAAQ